MILAPGKPQATMLEDVANVTKVDDASDAKTSSKRCYIYKKNIVVC